MDHRVKRLRTPKECESFARNAAERQRPDLVLEAQRWAVELKASDHDANTPLETEAFAAIYAYESLLTRRNGKKTRATRTWQTIKRHGIIEAIEREMKLSEATAGYETLLEMGMEDLAFESLILRYPESFSDEAVGMSKARLEERSKAWASA